jgi:4-hydroxy-tetrahydrodipicolinate synthase
MVNPPSVVKPGPEEIVSFYRDICEACDIEIMIQDAPLMPGSTSVPTLVTLCQSFPAIESTSKWEQPPTTVKITALKQALGDSVGLFGGRMPVFSTKNCVAV